MLSQVLPDAGTMCAGVRWLRIPDGDFGPLTIFLPGPARATALRITRLLGRGRIAVAR